MRKLQRLIILVLALVLVCVPLLRTDASAAGNDDYLSLEEAGAQLREYMVERKTDGMTIRFYLDTDLKLSSSQVHDLLEAEAFKHTGKGNEGDALYWNYRRSDYSMTIDYDGKTMKITCQIRSSEYNTNASQEKELDTKVQQILEELDLSGKTDYDKIFAIYDYVCKNVTYSEAYLSGEYAEFSAEWYLVHSAYSALVKGEAVCQGFATAMYRLLLDAGIDNRLVSGDEHGWNIVRLGDQYYCLDSTWDSGKTQYEWFLMGSSSFCFPGHTPEYNFGGQGFVEQYPVSVLDYGDQPTATGSGQCGDHATWTLSEDGTLTISGSGAIGGNGNSSVYWAGLHGYIKKIVIESGITSIGDQLFYNCQAVQSVSIPNTVTFIGERAFGLCTKLQEIQIPDGVTEIGAGAFTCCWRLREVNLPADLQVINDELCEHCVDLEEITIPAGVKTMGAFAFAYCTNIERAIFQGDAPACGENPFSSLGGKNLTIYYPADNATWTDEAMDDITRGNARADCISYRYENGHRWAYGWIGDDTAHWYPCLDCDDKTNVKAHEYEYDCDRDCEICGHLRVAEHKGLPYYDVYTHWYQCVCGENMGGYGDHVYDGNCDTTCDECGYVRWIVHDYSIWKWDDTHHWRECACGAQDSYSEHYYAWGNLKCTDCGYDNTANCTHFYNDNCDATCDWCGEEREALHYFNYGWDKDQHWLDCRCGMIKEGPEAHTWSNGNCTVCGAAGGASTQPTEPAPTEPAPTQPAPTQPAPTEPAPTEPAPTEPAPTQPAPTEPAPTEPAPTEPAPTEPAPTQPAPTQPAPTEPTPTEPAPTEPTPTEPAPTEPTQTEPAPTVPTETVPGGENTTTEPTQTTAPSDSSPTQPAESTAPTAGSSAQETEETAAATVPADQDTPAPGNPAILWVAVSAVVIAAGGATAGVLIKKRKAK